MATSGSADYNDTQSEIVTDALVLCGAIEAGDTPSAEDSAYAVRQLNRMVKAWQADGTHLWKVEEAVVFLTKGKTKYLLGSDHASLENVKTELAADVLPGAGSITVDSITDIANADTVGVVLDDGTIHWTTVNGAPSGVTVTLTDVTTGAASTDAHVYIYTTRLVRPLRMTSARRRDDAGNDIPMLEWDRTTYFDTPNKTAQSPPTAVYYDPQLTNGELHVWPAPDTVNDRLLLAVDMPIEDFDAAGDTPDLPQEWLDCLVWSLARKLCPSYGTPREQRDEIAAEAADLFTTATGWDRDVEGFSVEPDLQGYG